MAAATGVPTEGVAPPTHLPPSRISPNPDNPRSSLGDLTDLAGSLRDHGQKQAITVMNRDAYVKANPEREADLEPDTAYVVIDGSSRLAAAREAGLARVAVMVSDDQGDSADEILESALIANIMRSDLNEIDEAHALRRLLATHGSQRALAKRLHRSQGWVSQRLALLNLGPELQARIGEEPIELLRAVGSKPVDGQEAALEELKAQRSAVESVRGTQRMPEGTNHPSVPAPVAPVADHGAADYAVITDAASVAAPAVPAEQDEVTSLTRPDVVPDPRSDAGPSQTVEALGERDRPTLPYHDGWFVALHLIRKMSVTEFDRMLHILNDHRAKRDAAGAESAVQ
ncbi:ParB/RepB/Spo0J family partition protein [Streptomyces sp. NPDC051014]|uniref:ParB/RepB/Spo0J family partition protein n=1 Tax=Streptomyces sp. NPDC051014 TaxID=3155751 RepID=UPI0033CB32D8